MPVQLDVSEEQLRILDELVSDRIMSLGTEIRHCDNRDYRHTLVQQREQLRSLSSQLSNDSPSSV